MRIRLTIEALNNLARYLSSLPGRKNLIWFSGSFLLNLLPEQGVWNKFDAAADFENEFHLTVEMLTRSQVAVYPIDARGLMLSTAPMQDASGGLASLPHSVMNAPQKFFNDTAAEHSTMQDLANDTGGVSFADNNGLAAAVQRAVDAGSNFYSLTYTPSNGDLKADFHKVQVQLAQAGLKLTYRRGYYSDDSSAAVNAPPAAAPKAAPSPAGTGTAAGRVMGATMNRPAAVMDAAMQFGGPDPTEILFKAAINPATGDTEATLARGNIPDPKVKGPFRRYVVYIAALPSDFTITSVGGGKYRMNVELDTNVYNANGELLNYATIHAGGEFGEERYKALMRAGLQFRQEISVPVKGQSFLRVGVEDIASSRVGAIEVPVATLVNLKPLAEASKQGAIPANPPK